jgi:hypothetical protein
MEANMHGNSSSERHWGWWALAVSVVLSLPYLLSVQSFFASDDWVHLSYNRAIPPWQVWRYFSPRVVWFYRPLQALQFGWLYHAVGLRPLAYNLCLWTMHLGVCLLVYVLASKLTTRRTALLATAMFGAQWAYLDVVTWPSNFSTLHWAIVTLGMCILFLRFLESRRPGVLAGVYALFLVDLVAKESAVSAPLLLAALWWWQAGGKAQPAPLRTRLREGGAILTPLAAITMAYLGFHRWVVHDVYQDVTQLYYHFVPPGQAMRQALFAFNHLLLSFYSDPVVLPKCALLQRAVQQFVQHIFILPFVLAAVAWRSRDRMLGLGLFWVFATLIPTVFLDAFHTSRFYYLPAVGSALILARCGEWCWRCVSASEAPLRPLRLALPVALAYVLLANVSLVALLCLRMRGDSRLTMLAFHVLSAAGGQIPRGSLIVMKNPPQTSLANGLGVPEMVRMALRDPAAEAVVEGQRLPDAWIQHLRQIPSVYILDFARQPLALRTRAEMDPMGMRADRSRPAAEMRASRPLP